MSVTISEALQQAQDAIGSGNYRAAVSTCGQLVQQFPHYAAAHRLLGEAWLEQGQNGEAERAFSAALAGNPRNPWAYLGLGLIAEDRGATDPAMAFTQVAWELAPNVGQLREPLRRTAMRRYGADGQLQYTRAALAQLHANNARLRRAADEYRAALAELPDRVDLQLGYAEVLWRLGQDTDAANLCRELLEHHADAVQALVILADIEHRTGDAQRAESYLARARAVDPDGAVVAGMLEANPRADHDWLQVHPEALPVVAEADVSAAPDMPQIPPAPDFEYVPSRPEARPGAVADLRPMELEEFGAEPAGVAPVDDAGFLLDDFEGQPFDPTDITSHDLGVAAAAAVAGQPAEPWAEPGDDALGSLAAALEGDVAGALARAGGVADAAPLSDDPADFLPPDVPPAGYTTMLRELDDAGLAPFDALDQSMPAPQLPDDLLALGLAEEAAGSPAPAPQPGEQMEALEALANDWDAIDHEIQSAVPWDVPHGYTEELRSLEGIGLEPFAVEDAEDAEDAGDVGTVAPPLVAAAGIPADMPPLEELVAETPSVQPEQVVADVEPDDIVVAAVPSEPPIGDDVIFADLEPFAAEEFEHGPLDMQTRPFSFGPAPWDAQGHEAGATRSAVPSDADLEEILAMEEEARAAAQHHEVVTTEVSPPPLPEPIMERLLDQPAGSAEGATLPAADLGTGWDVPAAPWNAQEELHDMFGSSLAVTRALGAQEPSPAEASPLESAAADATLSGPLEELRRDAGMFDRARAVKEELIETGAISGNLELEPVAPEALSAAEPQFAAVDTGGDARAEPEQDADIDVARVTGSGAFRDVDTLRAALNADPNDAELRWWLSQALRERGDTVDAIGEYRWLVRNAPERSDAIIADLHALVDQHQEPELAHRVLADIYRRRGDSARASRHAALSLQSRKRG